MYKSMTEAMVLKVEEIFGIKSNEWRKHNLIDLQNKVISKCINSNMIAYCLNLLLCNDEDIIIHGEQDLMKYFDNPEYMEWFISCLLEIDRILIDNGIETCLKIEN